MGCCSSYLDVCELRSETIDVRAFTTPPFVMGIYDFAVQMYDHIKHNATIKCLVNLEACIVAASFMTDRYQDRRNFLHEAEVQEWRLKCTSSKKDIKDFNLGIVHSIWFAVSYWNDLVSGGKLNSLIVNENEAISELNKLVDDQTATRIKYSRDNRFMTVQRMQAYIKADYNRWIKLPLISGAVEYTMHRPRMIGNKINSYQESPVIPSVYDDKVIDMRDKLKQSLSTIEKTMGGGFYI